MARIAEIPRDSMSSAQKTVFDEIAGGPRGGVRGPFLPLLNSPVLADKVQKLGQFVRYECSIPRKLRELAILVTAFHWKAQYEWFAHESEAIKAGLSQDIIDAIKGEINVSLTAEEISNIDELKDLLIQQIENRVRWRESVINMIKSDVNHFIEIGPGKVLSGLIKRINRDVKIDTINNQEDIKNLEI